MTATRPLDEKAPLWVNFVANFGQKSDLKGTHHTLVDPVVLLLQPRDGEGALVLLVPLLGQVEAIRSSPSDRRSWTSRRTARERHFLADALHVLVLGSQLDRGRVPNMHLWDRSNLATLLRKYQQDAEHVPA